MLNPLPALHALEQRAAAALEHLAAEVPGFHVATPANTRPDTHLDQLQFPALGTSPAAVRPTHGASPSVHPTVNALLGLLTLPNIGALVPVIEQAEPIVAAMPAKLARVKAVIAAEEHKTGLQFLLDLLASGGVFDSALTAAELRCGISGGSSAPAAVVRDT